MPTSWIFYVHLQPVVLSASANLINDVRTPRLAKVAFEAVGLVFYSPVDQFCEIFKGVSFDCLSGKST